MFKLKEQKLKISLCVELKKVKLEMILKVEAHIIFVLCSRKVMQQNIGRDERNLRGVFFCVVFS